MSGVERLREAAKVMRSRAAVATDGPWSWREEHGRDYTDEGWSYVAVETARDHAPGEYGEEVAATAYPGDSEGGDAQADATHIASWHPAVALAVADWLDAAYDDERRFAAQGAHGFPGVNPAFAVADAYLGSPS